MDPWQNPTGLGQYLIFSGPSPSSLVQIGIAAATNTTYRNLPLSPATTYYWRRGGGGERRLAHVPARLGYHTAVAQPAQ